MWVQLTDLSPKYRYPVFGTTGDDRGYRVVAYGSAFPIKTGQTGKTYFLTSRHVIESGDQLTKECERFYAAMRLAAERTANGKDVDSRFYELLSIVNLRMKRTMTASEKALYTSTIDGIWDYYENFLSVRADPGRVLFKKFVGETGVDHQCGYFLHKPGPVTETPLEAQIYKIGRSESDPDLAILAVESNTIPCLEFEQLPAEEGEEIQVIGYPTASDQIDIDSSKYYAPTFNTGRISRIAPHILQVDAPITTGNSGGPVVSQRGKVLGVVAVRALSSRGGELPNFGGAVTISSVQTFAPELFSKRL
jgi:S1-C subfamily serine protease